MSQASMELEIRREAPRKQLTGSHVSPTAPMPDDANTTTAQDESLSRKKRQTRTARVQFAVCCTTLFIAGWDDGTLGPLLPRIQKVYHVGPAVQFQSMDAQANGYVASLERNAATKIRVMHAVYGAGALSAPLVATQFAQLRRWSFHFLVLLGLSLANTILLIAVFRFHSQDECLLKIGQMVPEYSSDSNNNRFRQILRHRAVHLLAFYTFVHFILGWIVTLIIQERQGGSSSGYISAGFFGGLVVGCVALLWVNKKIGERVAIFIYAFLAIGLELVVWLVPSLIGNAVAVSLVGLLLGPMYPIVMNHARRMLPRWILTGSIGWIAGFGVAGSAVVPFMTGASASKFGIESLQPFLVAMMGFMIVMWTLVPGSPRRPD